MPVIEIDGNEFVCPFCEAMKGMDHRSIKSMLGNAVCSCSIGNVIAYICRRLVVKSKFSRTKWIAMSCDGGLANSREATNFLEFEKAL